MELAVDPCAILVDELQGVAVVSIHVPEPISTRRERLSEKKPWISPREGSLRDTSDGKKKEKSMSQSNEHRQCYLPITHENHNLVDRLRVLRKIIPEVGRVVGAGQMSFGVSLLSVDEVRELGRVSQEEHRRVVGDPIKVSFGRSELDGETSRVTGGIRSTSLTTNSGESNGDGTLGALLEHGGQTEIVHVVGTDKLAVSAGALGCKGKDDKYSAQDSAHGATFDSP